MSMNIVILGSSGALGFKLWHGLSVENNNITSVTGTSGIDIRNQKELEENLNICSEQNHPIDMIINCAAYTDVVGAETLEGSKKAWDVNTQAVGVIAGICVDRKIHLIHFSTDYVFGGQNNPLMEYSSCYPVQNYGRTKLAGELAIQTIMGSGTWTIVRTSTLYGPPRRPSFVKTIVRNAVRNDKIVVVDSQRSSPTSTDQLAHLVEQYVIGKKLKGIVHATSRSYCTKFEFSKEIVNLLGIKCHVQPRPEDREIPHRPSYSVLENGVIKCTARVGFQAIPDWRVDLASHFETHQTEWQEYIKKCKSELL